MVNKEIIDMLHYKGFPFIHFSSSEVYGKNWTEPYTEESDCILGSASKQRWIYATSKLLLDQYILSSKMNCCILRPFNFIGHDIDWLPDIHDAISKDKTWIPRVPACFLNSLFMKKPMTIVNPGTQSRCYTHIDDAVLGILSVVDNWDKCSGEIINIGNPDNEINIETLAKKMSTEWKSQMGERAKRPKHIDGTKFYGKGYEDSNRRLFSDAKMRKLTGWKASMGINETIRTTVKDAIEVFKSHEDNSIRCR
jgi:UDP-apiose/xylose synthase